MSQILRDLNKLAAKIGAPVVGTNISEQVRALSTFWEGTSHGANIAERINELAHSEVGKVEEPVLVDKSIIQNGIYNATDDDADGYKKVSVVVPDTPQNYTDVACTRAEYEAMEGHSNKTIYTVTNPDTTVNKYLGDDQIGFSDDAGTKDMANVNGGYIVSASANVPGKYPIDWTKPFDIVVCFYLPGALPSAFSNNQFLFGGTGSWSTYTRLPAWEFNNNHLGVLIGTGSGWSSKGGGWLSGQKFNELLDFLSPEQGNINYLKWSHLGEGHYTVNGSKDGIHYTQFVDVTGMDVQYQNTSNEIQFAFGLGDRSTCYQGSDFRILYDRCAIYSEGVLVFGNEPGAKPKDFST